MILPPFYALTVLLLSKVDRRNLSRSQTKGFAMATIRVFAALLLLLISAPAHGQAVLTTDSPFSYTFTNLQARTVIPGGHVDGHVDGQLRLSLSQFDPGDQMRIEMFESSTAGVPFYSTVWNVMPPAIPTTNAWVDLQGALRFTMLNGTAVLDSFEVGLLVPFINQAGTVSSVFYASTFVPVPEPATLGLIIAGAAFLLMRRLLKSRRVHRHPLSGLLS